MQIASFTTNSIVWLACCSILLSLQRMGWSSVQACSAIADLSMKPMIHAKYSFRRVSSQHVASAIYTFPQVHGTSLTTLICSSLRPKTPSLWRSKQISSTKCHAPAGYCSMLAKLMKLVIKETTQPKPCNTKSPLSDKLKDVVRSPPCFSGYLSTFSTLKFWIDQ